MNSKKHIQWLSLLIVFLVFFGFGQSAWAATITAIADGPWNAGGTWSGGIPGASDDVIIPTGIDVTSGAGVTAKTITINGTGTLTITQPTNIATAGTGGITLNGTSILKIDAAVAIAIGNTTYQGNIVMNDNSAIEFTTGTASLTLSGTWTKSADATFTLTLPPNLFLEGTTDITLPDGLTNLSNLTVTKVTGTATLSENLTIGTDLDVVSGTLVVGNNNLTVTGVTDVDIGATLNASATTSSTRAIGAVTRLTGTLNLSGTTVNTLSGIITFDATGVLNLNYSRTTLSAVPVFAAGCVINALGADLLYSAGLAIDFTNTTVNTNNNTALRLAASAAITVFPLITELRTLVITSHEEQAITLRANLTITDSLNIGNGANVGNAVATILNSGNFNITVNGPYLNGAATTGYNVVDIGTGTLTLNGPIVDWGFDHTTLDVAAGKLVIGGSGNIETFLVATAGYNIGEVTMNRVGANLDLTGINQATTFASLTITAGTVTLGNGVTATISGATSIGANGTLVANDATSVTFAGAVSGTGIIDASIATDQLIFTTNSFTFTGNLLVDVATKGTIIQFNNGAAVTATLPSSVTVLGDLQLLGGGAINITLSNDLEIVEQLVAANNKAAGSIITINGYTLTLTGGIGATAAGSIVATNGSTLVSVAAANFSALTLTEDETTNLEFRAAPTLVVGITQCNNLTIVGATAVALVADFTINGDLDIQAAGGSLVTGAFDLTVYGDISNSGTLDLDDNTNVITLTIYGLMQGGTYTTSGQYTNLSVQGTSSQLILPYGITLLHNLTLNRATGMKLNANLAIGLVGVTGLVTITSGDLDLNGNLLTLATVGAAATLISETAGNTVINTGASGGSNGYVTVSSTTLADVLASGIGVITATGSGVTTVYRYPITVPVPGVGLSTSRVYKINNAGAISALTLQFDNTELYSSASDLELYISSGLNFAVNTNVSDVANVTTTVSENTPSSGFGQVALTGAGVVGTLTLGLNNYYALAAVPGDGGVMKTFAATSGNWGDANSWSPSGIPTKIDQVVVGPATVYLNGNGTTYEAKTLLMNHANGTLLPTDNGINGDLVTLRIMGDLTLTAGAEILGVNGDGRLNLYIGDGLTTGVSSEITSGNNYVDGSGIWVHDLTINTADVEGAANRIRISGDVNLISNSAVELDNVEFWGGYGSQTISVPSSSNLSMDAVRLDNNAIVGTISDLTITGQILAVSGSTYNATGGTTLFNDPVNTDGDPWLVESGATLKFYDVVFNSSAGFAFTPLGTAYIQGSFYQNNTADFAPTSGTIIFSNSSQKRIENTKLTGDLQFYNLEVSANSQVVTSNDWQVQKQIDVKNGASLTADNGTITMDGTAPLYIKNASTQTLEFNNLTISAPTYTSDSWTIKGNLIVTAGDELIADKGTITFENIQQKYINNAGGASDDLQFFKIKIADGSKLTTNTTHDFHIKNNSTNPTGAGIEVEGTGSFIVGAATSVITFDAGLGIASGNPKTITKSSAGTLEFGSIVIAATPNNEVTTASDFEITATGAAAFNNAGAGGKFTATAGTITFSGLAPQIQSVSPAVTQFYSLATEGATTLTFPSAPTVQEFYVAGNITLNDQSSITAVDAANTKMIFNGSSTQTIGGNTSATTPIVIPDFVLNKSNNSELVLAINTVFGESSTGTDDELTLTNGILNLGSSTLTVYSDVISRQNGLINGATGTYVIGTNHAAVNSTQNTVLEDIYFTINGTPTLYNLTVNVANKTANDLTVNGTLNLNAGIFTIGSGSSSDPMQLILNGDLTRTSGTINGSVTDSRLVLQGTGTVDGGLSNDYFNLGAATTAQLEVARQETLGDDLNIATNSSLRINTGINSFDISTFTLEFDNNALLTMISGGIDADAGAVIMNNDITTLPATMFRNNTVEDLTIVATTTLGGDLTINGTLTGPFDITTNDNTLTFGPSATLPTFTDELHVIGNLRRYVTNIATVFNIGGGDAASYVPVTLQFANASSSQAVKISREFVNPTLDRGGNASDAVSVLWTITPEGTDMNDSLKMIVSWPGAIEFGTAALANGSFPAKWNVNSWTDYRNNLSSFTPATPRVLTMSGYALANPAALKGEWSVFNAKSATNAAKDEAIKVNGNKIVITNMTPTPVALGSGFSATVQLQDYLDQPITASTAFSFTISLEQGTATTFADFTGIIPAGQNSVTVSGLSFTGVAGADRQLKVDTTGSSANWTPTSSELFDVLPVQPTAQANTITFTNVGNTSMTITWTEGVAGSELVLIKADTLLTASEYPVNGTKYFANTIMGAGSSLGDANVIYVGDGQTVNVTGLSPNTTYFVYVFAYTEANGTYTYRTTAAAGNPKSQKTTGSIDDDAVLGTNNTMATSKAIGTNTPFSGTIKTADDVDWFNFTITNSSPNLRGQLTLSASLGNYNIEIYNVDGRRLRRGTLLGNDNEAQIINDLPAGTYLVKIFGVDGAFDASNAYTLKMTTKNTEIYSVTD